MPDMYRDPAPPPRKDGDREVEFFRDLSQQKQARLPAEASYVRLSGFVIGALMGLAYSLVSQNLNSFYLPGLPLAHAPFGLAGNLLATALGGALIGLLCAWPKSGLNGVTLGGFFMVALLELRAWLVASMPLSLILKTSFAPAAVFGIVFTFLLTLPLLLLLRWAIDVQAESAQEPLGSWKRLRLPLAIVVLAGFMGSFAFYSPEVRQSLNSMQAILRQGLRASSEADLPSPLRPAYNVEGFLRQANPDYTLQVGNDALLERDYSVLESSNSATILVRFRGGYALSCTFRGEVNLPDCRSLSSGINP